MLQEAEHLRARWAHKGDLTFGADHEHEVR